MIINLVMAEGIECALEASIETGFFNSGEGDGISSFKSNDILVSFPTEVSII